MDTTQVCAYLNISTNNLHQMQYRNQIKWVERKGRRVFYNREDIEAFKLKRDSQ